MFGVEVTQGAVDDAPALNLVRSVNHTRNYLTPEERNIRILGLAHDYEYTQRHEICTRASSMKTMI